MVDINSIFKEFDPSDISTNVIEREAVYAWLFPDRRQSGSQPISKDTLEDFALRPGVPTFQPSDPIPQVDNGGQNERYFFRVYDDTPGIRLTKEATKPQFYVTYGHRDGAGAPDLLSNNSTAPTKGIYNQYAQLLRVDDYFFEDAADDDFYAINFDTEVFEERLRNGEWELTLEFDGEELTLVDESVTDPAGFFNPNEPREQLHELEVVPGDLDNRQIESNPAFSGTYGYVYPSVGIIVLNVDALVQEASAGGPSSVETILPETRDPNTILNDSGTLQVQQVSGNYEWTGGFNGSVSDAEDEFPDWPYVRNHRKLFDVIDAGESFRAQGEVTVVEVNFSVDVEEDEFNFSLNPTYADDDGNITFREASGEKQGSYITTIGLYDDEYRQVAVAKISPPQFNDFGDSFSSDVTLDF